MESFDLIIIGSGPAGYTAATHALDFKKNVCIIEENHFGGAGIMNGALTSKAMWEISKDYSVAAAVDRGYRANGLVIDYTEMRKSVIQAARFKQFQMLSQVETFSPIRSKERSLVFVEGRAKFLNRKTIEVTKKDGTIQLLYGKYFLIATGSRPREISDIPSDGERIITSDHILNLKAFPERIAIIGSGIVGCEFAAIFSNFKQTEVHLLDRAHRVIPYEDDDVSDFVSRNLEKNGVNIYHSANLRTIRKYDTHLEVILDYEAGHSQVLEVDTALISIGRVPNVENLGLENVGIEVNKRGFLDITDKCRLNPDENECNIFAAGDVTGSAQLFSIAEFEGRNAIEAMYGKDVSIPDYSTMSTLMFFKPAVAAVGMNEKMLQKAKIPYRAVYYSNKLVNRAIAQRNTEGFVKIMVSDDENNQILGMRAGGSQASSFIISVAHFIKAGQNLHDVMNIIYPHPSMPEAIQDCLRVFDGKSIYKPSAFPDLIKVKSWKPE